MFADLLLPMALGCQRKQRSIGNVEEKQLLLQCFCIATGSAVTAARYSCLLETLHVCW